MNGKGKGNGAVMGPLDITMQQNEFSVTYATYAVKMYSCLKNEHIGGGCVDTSMK